ncbi:MAG: Rho-binding antiterminator [Burkholderiaceae bacterium]|nr:Rho-binding antiterminator [Burkholderiaceae bacterium]
MHTTAHPTPYEPIRCDFYDVLEALAMAKKPVEIRFRDHEGVVQSLCAAISDLFSLKGSEFLLTSTGDTVRLDQLVTVDDFRLADYESTVAPVDVVPACSS